MKTHKRNKTPSPRTPKYPTRKLTPKCLTLEQIPSVQTVQDPVVDKPKQNPSVQNVHHPVVDKSVLISSLAVKHSFIEELSVTVTGNATNVMV